MRPQPAPGDIRPKISTMPRQKTEAAAYLNIYKLTVEKKRLQQELETLEQRRERIQRRLALLDTQITDLESSAHNLRESDGRAPKLPPSRKPPLVSESQGNFTTFDLEY